MSVLRKRWMSYVLSLGTKRLDPILMQELHLMALLMALELRWVAPCSHKTAPRCHPTT